VVVVVGATVVVVVVGATVVVVVVGATVVVVVGATVVVVVVPVGHSLLVSQGNAQQASWPPTPSTPGQKNGVPTSQQWPLESHSRVTPAMESKPQHSPSGSPQQMLYDSSGQQYRFGLSLGPHGNVPGQQAPVIQTPSQATWPTSQQCPLALQVRVKSLTESKPQHSFSTPPQQML